MIDKDVFLNDPIQAEGRRVLESVIKQNVPSHKIKTVLALLHTLLSAARNEGARDSLKRAMEVVRGK